MEGTALLLHLAAVCLGLVGFNQALETISALLDHKYLLAVFKVAAVVGFAGTAYTVWSAA